VGATQRVEVLALRGDAVALRVTVIHPDEGDLYPDKAIALQWLIGGLPAEQWRLVHDDSPLAPLADCAGLARLLRSAGVADLPPTDCMAHFAWWLLDNERRVVAIEWLEEREERGLPEVDVRVRVGSPALVAHLSPGQTWEGAPFPPMQANPAPVPRPPSEHKPGTERHQRKPGLVALLAAHEGDTLTLGRGMNWVDGDDTLLSRWSGLKGVVALTINKPIGDAGLITLAASPHAGNLRRLTLEAARVAVEGLDALGTARGWPALTELALEETDHGEAALALPETPLWSRLTSLSLVGAYLAEGHALSLLHDPPPNLRALNLSANDLRDPAILGAIAALPHLDALDISGTLFEEAAWVAALPELSPLTRLELAGNDISRVSLDALRASAHWSSLRELDLTNTALTDADLLSLAEGPPAPKLERLRLYNVSLSLSTLTRLLEGPGLPGLRHLALGENAFDPPEAADLSDRVTLSFER